MHLADAFIQSDLHCIQVTVSKFFSALAFPGNRTHDLGVASAMLYQLSYRRPLGVATVFLHMYLQTRVTLRAFPVATPRGRSSSSHGGELDWSAESS